MNGIIKFTAGALACSLSLSGVAFAQGVIEARLTVVEKVKTGDATICFRHNSTFIQIPAARLSPKSRTPVPQMPQPGIDPLSGGNSS